MEVEANLNMEDEDVEVA